MCHKGHKAVTCVEFIFIDIMLSNKLILNRFKLRDFVTEINPSVYVIKCFWDLKKICRLLCKFIH